jgi:RNA polymerase subunit RPABC4/transcription elongation factor Spt4
LWYSAGAEEFKSCMMDKLDDMNYTVVLANIPIDTTVLYYIEMLDRGGVWLKRYMDEKEQTPFEFSTSREGVQEISNWSDPDLIKCTVCDYMCRREWDICPGCRTPLHDQMLTQEIFQEDQLQKERIRAKETDPDVLAWKSVESEEIILSECPSCGYAYQPDWDLCPICNYDLKKNQNREKELDCLKKKPKPENKNIDVL